MLIVDDRGEAIKLTLVTDCCGARLWIELKPEICPTCGRAVTITGNVERRLDHLTGNAVSRYWS